MKPNGKRSLADNISRRPKPDRDVRRNPFELFLTKAKHVVAGRKTKALFDGGVLGKFQKKGKPGKKQNIQVETQGLRSVSRNAALTNRKASLLNEYKTRTKKNKVVDRRLGEKDATMTIEDKMMERVMYERKQSAKTKRAVFNLNEDFDDDDLRFGQTLADEERLDVTDDEKILDHGDEADDILGEKFVSEHHFGGGLLRKMEPSGDAKLHHPKQVRADRNLLIDDIIAESKLKKYTKQSELDEIRDMTSSLDAKWGDVEVRKLISAAFSQAAPEPLVDSYDSLVKMLQFDTKAKASNKMKSDSELAKDAKEELDQAEKTRLTPKRTVSAAVISHGLQLLEPEIDDMSEEGDNDDVELEDEDKDEDEPALVELPAADLVAPENSLEIPFVIGAPETRKALLALLRERSVEEVQIIVKRIMQYHHISLAEENRGKLIKFFRLLFDFALSFGDDRPAEAAQLWNLLTPCLVQLLRISLEQGAELIRSRLEALSSVICKKTNYKLVPSAVLFLKFVTLCYPPADACHPVTATLNLLLGKLLSNAIVENKRYLLSSLFVASLATDNVLACKKYFPELIHYLRRVLAAELLRKDAFVDICDYDGKFSICDVLNLSENDVGISAGDRAKAFSMTLGILRKLIPVYSGLPAYTEIFDWFIVMVCRFKQRQFPEGILLKLDGIKELVASNRQSREYLTFSKKRPTSLKLLEPKLDDKFDRSKSTKQSDIKRLTHDKKRAVKGAKRELRRDNQFIARVQLDEQTKKDATRQKKVREIFTNLYSQEGEHKAAMRQKAKFKI